MRRPQMLALTAAVAMTGIAVVLIVLPVRSSPRMAAVSRYLAYQQQYAGVVLRTERQSKALSPEALLSSVGGATFGTGIYYRTDYSARADGYLDQDAAFGETLLSRPDVPDGLRPLPYPPQEVWCVWLDQISSAPAGTERIVLAARHEDLYNAEWVIHAPTSSSSRLTRLVNELHCDAGD
ncbi:MAG: hypothetical protein ACK2UO_07745 [Caldilineaceae bacterium]